MSSRCSESRNLREICKVSLIRIEAGRSVKGVIILEYWEELKPVRFFCVVRNLVAVAERDCSADFLLIWCLRTALVLVGMLGV